MNFAELVTETQLWAKAPHMDGAIRSAIRAVTLKYHRKEKFWRDLTTLPLTFSSTEFVQVIDIAANFPRFRQLLSVSGQYPTNGSNGTDLTIVQPGDLLEQDGYARTNIAVLAGTSLNLKFGNPSTVVQVTYYQDPVVSPENLYSSWIADTQPDLIIAGAAARALAWNAESEIYQAAAKEEAAQWIELLQNNIEGVGR